MLPSLSRHLSTHQKGRALDTPDLSSFHSGGNLAFSSCTHLSRSPGGPHASSFTGQGGRWAVDSGRGLLALNLALALGSAGPWANYLTSFCSVSSSMRWGNCTQWG